MWLSAPMLVGPLMTTCGPITRARADADVGPDDAERRRRSRPRASCACGETIARGSITWTVSGATIMSACATSCSPTSAAVEKRQMPRSERSSCARQHQLVARAPPGLRKRALSMPTK